MIVDSLYRSIEVCQIRPSGFLIYDKLVDPYRGERKKQKSLTDNFNEKSAYSGTMTKHAKKRLARAISLLVAISDWQTVVKPRTGEEFKMKLNFITLTLPAEQSLITDQEIKKQCFEPFILAMRRKYNMRSYIWRAERQKNGNIHFHITTNVFVPYDQLRDIWNEKLNNLGFVDKFEKLHGHKNPNSTDVHAVRKIKDIQRYLVKYFSKDTPADQIITGKVWDCSRNLKQKENCELHIDNELDKCISAAILDNSTEVVYLERCTFVNIIPERFYKYVTGNVKNKYLEWISLIKDLPEN